MLDQVQHPGQSIEQQCLLLPRLQQLGVQLGDHALVVCVVSHGHRAASNRPVEHPLCIAAPWCRAVQRVGAPLSGGARPSSAIRHRAARRAAPRDRRSLVCERRRVLRVRGSACATGVRWKVLTGPWQPRVTGTELHERRRDVDIAKGWFRADGRAATTDD